jgi:hypothetical protein
MDQTYTQDSCCCREQPGAGPASSCKGETGPNDVATPGPSESSSISEAYMAAFLDSIVGWAKVQSGVRDKDQKVEIGKVAGWNRNRTRNARMKRGEGRHPPPILLYSDQAELRDEAAALPVSVKPLAFAMGG